MNSLAILGASGHGKVIAEIAELNGFENIVFFDDRWPSCNSIEHWEVLGDTKALLKSVVEYDAVVIGIGNNSIRLSKHLALAAVGAKFCTLIHPSASVSKYVCIADGTVIMANASVNAFSKIGKSCIVNTNSSVDHDCTLEDGSHISPGANLAGGVHIGRCSWVGIGSQIRQLVAISDNVTVGAGSTVINNIGMDQIVLGSPAKKIRRD